MSFVKKSLGVGIYNINVAALLIGAAGLFSRLLGILRDRLLASHFGASRELDIYYAAFQIPDFMFALFLLGAASAAIIPIFLETRAQSYYAARLLIARLVRIFLYVSIPAIAAAFFIAPAVMNFIAPGFSADERSLAVLLSRIMLLSPVLLGLSGIVSSVVQSFRRFLVYSLAPIAYNLGIILGILVLLPRFGLPGLAWGVALGALGHLMIQLPVFFSLLGSSTSYNYRESGFLYSFVMGRINKIFKLALPRVIALSVNNLTVVILVALASTLTAGSIAVFQLAYNLHYVPVGLFGISFAVASFPALSEDYIKRNSAAFIRTFYATLKSVLFWVAPLAVFFYVLRAQIVRIFLGAGKFDWEATRLTAASLGLFVFSMVALSLIPILTRAFYALENTSRPLKINAVSSAFTIGFAFFLTALFSGTNYFVSLFTNMLRVGDLPEIGVLGIPIAMSLGGIINLIWLLTEFRSEIKRKFVGEDAGLGGFRSLNRELLKIIIAAPLAGFAVFGTLRIVNLFVSLNTFIGVFTQGFLASLAGAAVYAAILYFWKSSELNNLIAVLRKHLFRPEILPESIDSQNFK